MSRVLVFGHNPFHKELPNGRTLLELFSRFSKDDLAELFIHPDIPNFDVCENYFRITDLDMLKKGVLRLSPGGKIVRGTNTEIPKTGDRTQVYKIGSKRRSYIVTARNFIWKIGKWFSKDLKNWIKDFQPDVLFFYLGNYSFTIDIALKISSYFHIPIVTYIVDDYYFNCDLKKGIFGGINHWVYSRKLHQLLNHRTVICINEYMKERYANEFDCRYHTIYTVSSLTPFENNQVENETIRMSFLGGIACDRYKSLSDIGKVIVENHLPINFSVYTRETREWMIAPLKEAPGLSVCGALSYQEVIEKMRKSDILIHVEGFSDDAINLVKYSLSTKIADTLSCNRCLLAYGPSEVASIRYLVDNHCAYVATSLSELTKVLIGICNNRKSLSSFCQVGLQIAQENHNRIKNYKKLSVIFESIISSETL